MTAMLGYPESVMAEDLDAGRLDEVIELGEKLDDALSEKAMELVLCAKRRKALVAKFLGGETRATQITCPRCSLKLRIASDSSRSVTCYGCTALIDLETLKAVGQCSKFKEKSALKTGMEGSLDGQKVRIMGRAMYRANIKEWDSEDKKYESSTWTWVEWSLLTAGGEVWYLCIDSEGYSLSKNLVPANPKVPTSVHDQLNLTGSGTWLGGDHRIQEWGEAKIVALEGELSWLPDLDKGTRYAEYVQSGVTYGVEWYGGGKGSPAAEAEFYEAKSLDYHDLLRGFDLKELLAEWDAERGYRSQRWRWALPFLFAAALFTSFWMAAGDSGRSVFAEHVPSIASLPDEGLVSGPFELVDAGALHKIQFAAAIPDNSELWVGVELLDENQNAINAADRDLWRESGYEDGERWSESDVWGGTHFMLENPGSYYLRIYAEPDPLKPVDGSVTFSVRADVTSGGPYGFSAICMFIVGVFVSPILRNGPPRRI